MVTKHHLRRLIGEARGAWFWRGRGRFAHKARMAGKQERVMCILIYRALRNDLYAGRCVQERNARGNIVLRDVDADRALRMRGSDRYAYDFGPCRNWTQFDTWQDAPYFGVWHDEKTRRIFTYCEGDRILVKCPTADSFAAEIADAIAFYQRGRKAA